MIQVLQIANGFLGNCLYRNLFATQETLDIQNTIYVPIDKKQSTPKGEADNVIISNCFSQLDRALFFMKQKHIVQDLEKRENLTKFNLTHAHTVFSGGYAAYRIKKKYNCPYIVAVRNTDVNFFFKYMLHLRFIGIKIMRRAEKIIFLSPTYQQIVLSKYVPATYQSEIQSKSVVIPNGISALFFEHLNSPKILCHRLIRLIYVGEISSNKNLELTIQAAELLRQKGWEVRLTVVGAILEEKYRPMLQRDFIEYHDRCPQEKVIQYLQNADIFVMPSHTETFGLVYAEAMSQGLPVLYTRGQGFDGQFPDGTVGFAVSDTDPRDIAGKIKLIIANYKALSTNCVRLVNKFRWESIAEQYKEIYQAIAKGK